MSSKRRALGRGLSSLIPEAPPAQPAPARPVAADPGPESVAPREGQSVVELDVTLIRPGSHQPRRRFDDRQVQELADSIRQSGVLQPVIVVSEGDGFVLVAGERRWRAAQRAGIPRIPAIVRSVPQEKRLEMALVENVQRADLNPMEEARAYRTLIRELGLTQAEVAQRVGKTRPTVANVMRLLDLPPPIQTLVEEDRLTMGHARALLALRSASEQRKLAEESVRAGLSVRELEERIRKMGEVPGKPVARRRPQDPNVAAAESELSSSLGTKVRIRSARDGRGRLEVHYRTEEELQRLYELFRRAGK